MKFFFWILVSPVFNSHPKTPTGGFIDDCGYLISVGYSPSLVQLSTVNLCSIGVYQIRFFGFFGFSMFVLPHKRDSFGKILPFGRCIGFDKDCFLLSVAVSVSIRTVLYFPLPSPLQILSSQLFLCGSGCGFVVFVKAEPLSTQYFFIPSGSIMFCCRSVRLRLMIPRLGDGIGSYYRLIRCMPYHISWRVFFIACFNR